MDFLRQRVIRGNKHLNRHVNKETIILRALLLSCFLFLFVNSCTPLTEILLKAAQNGDISKVEKLLSKGAEINAKDIDGRTALILATEEGHTDVVKMLIYKGAEVNAKDKGGGTALMYAASKGYGDIVNMLLEKDAKLP